MRQKGKTTRQTRIESQASFARRHGVTRQYVHTLIKQGFLSVDSRNKLIIPVADREWEQIRDPMRDEAAHTRRRQRDERRNRESKEKQAAKGRQRKTKEKKRKKPTKKRKKAAKKQTKASKPPPATEPETPLPPEPAIELDYEQGGAPTKPDVYDLLKRAQLAERAVKTKLKQLEYREKKGEVEPVRDVRADATRTAEYVRTRLLAMGDRLAQQLACDCRRAVEVKVLIEREINETLAGLQRSKYVKKGHEKD